MCLGVARRADSVSLIGARTPADLRLSFVMVFVGPLSASLLGPQPRLKRCFGPPTGCLLQSSSSQPYARPRIPRAHPLSSAASLSSLSRMVILLPAGVRTYTMSSAGFVSTRMAPFALVGVCCLPPSFAVPPCGEA